MLWYGYGPENGGAKLTLIYDHFIPFSWEHDLLGLPDSFQANPYAKAPECLTLPFAVPFFARAAWSRGAEAR